MPPDQIHVDSFMLADAAREFGGKLYVHGGGWNFLNVAGRDTQRSFSIVGRVVAPRSRSLREFTLIVYLEHTDSESTLERAAVVRMVLQQQVTPDQPQSIETATPFVIDVPGIGFYQPGAYAFVIEHEGEELARTRFQVNFAEDESVERIGETIADS